MKRMDFSAAEFLPHVMVIGLISLIDFVALTRARLTNKYFLDRDAVPCEDFTILIPIFGNMSYLKNVDFLAPYGAQVVLCTTTKESASFNEEIGLIAEKYNFRIFCSEVVRASSTHRPNPWALFRGTLRGKSGTPTLEEQAEIKINSDIARDEIIRDSFLAVTTKYCIFLDGDTVAKRDLRRLVGQMQKEDMDLCSVRVLASRKDTLMEKLQSVEYELAMDARKIYPWLTSGACMVAKTSVIMDIMSHHSLFFSGGDIEIGKLAKMLGYKVSHIPFVFYTDVPRTFKAWFKQRMAWFGGGFRHAIINMHRYTWRHPLFYFYMTVLVYLLLPLRWYELIKHPIVILLIIAMYWFLVFIFHYRRFKPFYFLFPFYALIQVMILVPLGVFTYFRMARNANNIGLIKLRDSNDAPLHTTNHATIS